MALDETLNIHITDSNKTHIIVSFNVFITTEDRESLKFKLVGLKDYETLEKNGIKSDEDNLGSWGHEYVRSLAGEIGQEYNSRVLEGADPDTDEPFSDLLGMVDVIVPFHISHNAEAEAVDLLIEVQRLSKLTGLDSIDEKNYSRICLYLIKTADFMSDPDDLSVSVILFLSYSFETFQYRYINISNISLLYHLTGNA